MYHVTLYIQHGFSKLIHLRLITQLFQYNSTHSSGQSTDILSKHTTMCVILQGYTKSSTIYAPVDFWILYEF